MSNGSADFEIMVGNDVPSGTQQVRVASAGENDTTNVVISGADLTVTPRHRGAQPDRDDRLAAVSPSAP